MIVQLGEDQTLEEARSAALRFVLETKAPVVGHLAEAAPPRRWRPSKRLLHIERERFNHKVAMTPVVVAAIRHAMSEIFGEFRLEANLREDDKQKKAANKINAAPLAAALKKSLRPVYEEGVRSANAELGATARFVSRVDEINPTGALDALYARTLEFAREVTDREKVGIKDILLRSIADGLSGVEAGERISEYLAEGIHVNTDRALNLDSWAEMVGRTEVSQAHNDAIFAVYEAAGVAQWRFMTSEDDRTCPECEDLDGEVFDLNEGEEPPIHVLCRCTSVSVEAGYDGDDGDVLAGEGE